MNDQIEQLNIQDDENIKKPNKVSFIVMIIIVLGLFIFGILSTNIIKLSTEKSSSEYIKVELKNISLELGSKISTNVIDYFNDPPPNAFEYKLNILNIPSVDNFTTEPGNYKYSVKYGSEIYKGSVIVKDSTNPDLYLKVLSMTIDNVSNIKIDDFIQYKYDASSNIYITYKNNTINNIKSNGTYYIEVVAKDASSNAKTVQTRLNIIGYKFLDSIYDNIPSYNSLRDNTWNNEYVSKFNYGVAEDTELYKTTYDYIKNNDWLSMIKDKYQNAIVNRPIELFNIYNQYDLVIGFGVRTIINDNGIDKTIFLSK